MSPMVRIASVDDARGHPHRCLMAWNIVEHDGMRADTGIVAHADMSEYRGTCPDQYAIANVRVP